MSPDASRIAVTRPGHGAFPVLVAVGAAAAGWVGTDLIAAVPAGGALALLAASDRSTHHFSVRLLGAATALVVVAMAADSIRHDSWDRMVMAAIGMAAVAVVLSVVWMTTSGIAFGDVLLVTFTVAVPMYVSAGAAVIVFVSALAVAVLQVGAWVVARGAARSRRVPLGPALLVGWVIGALAS